MTNFEGMTKPKIRKQDRHLFLAFEFCHCFVIRHLSFVI